MKINIDVSFDFTPPDYLTLYEDNKEKVFIFSKEDKKEVKDIVKRELFFFMKEKLKDEYDLDENFTID